MFQSPLTLDRKSGVGVMRYFLPFLKLVWSEKVTNHLPGLLPCICFFSQCLCLSISRCRRPWRPLGIRSPGPGGRESSDVGAGNPTLILLTTGPSLSALPASVLHQNHTSSCGICLKLGIGIFQYSNINYRFHHQLMGDGT